MSEPSAELPAPSENLTRRLPKSILYSGASKIGGTGLGLTAYESLLASYRGSFLGCAIGYANEQTEIPSRYITSLRAHPVRLLSFLSRPYYYGLKKHCADWVSSRKLSSGRFDLFHGWSGDCLRTLKVAKKLGIPSLIEIPTWHRNKGKIKPYKTQSERERDEALFPANLFSGLLVTRQQVLEEYELADIILLQSEKAKETFLVQGFDDERLVITGRGADAKRFAPGKLPPLFRALFVGALIKRKGVHRILQAWHQLNLKNAELLLVGSVHEEMKPYLERFSRPNIRIVGFSAQVEKLYQSASVFVFPSECEGSAKVTYEAAACGLAQITTREAGDVVRDGENGLVIPCDDAEAIAEALLKLYRQPELLREMGAAARRKFLSNGTWDHYRNRLLMAYEKAMEMAG